MANFALKSVLGCVYNGLACSGFRTKLFGKFSKFFHRRTLREICHTAITSP